jgi:hypothetical protein
MKLHVTIGIKVTLGGAEGLPDLERRRLITAHIEDIMDELNALDAVDADFTANLETGEVDFEMLVEAPDGDTAESLAAGTVRTAIHSAGGFTHEWWTLDWRESKSASELLDA